MGRDPLRRLLALALALCLCLTLAVAANASNLAVERQVFSFLTEEMGLNSAAACGVLANIEAESGFSLAVYGDSGTSYGLCQWHNGRFDNLRNFCVSRGYDYSSLEGQLNYLWFELRTQYTGTYAVLRNVPDTAEGAYQAAYYWCVHFEAPANREAAGVRRGNSAQTKYWLRYGGAASQSAIPVDSLGYNSSLFTSTLGASSFYWEAEEESSEETAPVSAASAAPTPAVGAPHPEVRKPAPASEETPQNEGRLVYRFQYVTHHSPLAQTIQAEMSSGVSPLSCLFLCAGEPKRPYRLTDPQEDEETEA